MSGQGSGGTGSGGTPLPGAGGKGGSGGQAFGGDYVRDRFPATYEEYLAQKAGKDAPGPSRYVTFDNEIGEVTLRLPPQYQRYQEEVLEALYEEYFGSPAGDRKVQDDMNAFVAEWLKKREREGSPDSG